MNDLKTILCKDPAPTLPSTAEKPNYKDRSGGVVSAGDSKKYLGKEYTIKEIKS